jgi:uncharacterized membrane protein
MEHPHYHLLVNHLPILLPAIGLCIMAGGLLLKSLPLQRTALVLFVVAGLTAFMAHVSGEKAEHALKNYPEISHERIEKHEEAAEPFTILTYCLGIFAAISFWVDLRKKFFARYLIYLTTAIGLLSTYFSIQTGQTGGEINHVEIRNESKEN